MITHDSTVTFTRQELYTQVWSTPMRKLASSFGISDVGLAKTCKRHEIPYPPRGYWAKVHAGERVRKPSLKAASDSSLENIHLTKRDPKARSQTDATKAAAAERKEENRIIVAEQLSDPHPLVERSLKSMASAKVAKDGRSKPRASRCLDIEISPPLFDRAGRIMDALIKALEARGYEVVASDGERPITWVKIGQSRYLATFAVGLFYRSPGCEIRYQCQLQTDLRL